MQFGFSVRWIVVFALVFLVFGCSEDVPPDPSPDALQDVLETDALDVSTQDVEADGVEDPDIAPPDVLTEDTTADVKEDVELADVVPAPVGAIVITEIMKNPQAVSDGDGEWVEIYNASDENVDLQGWTLGDAKNDGHLIETSLLIKPGETLVLAAEGDPALNGGVESVTYVYPAGSFLLGNGSDEVILTAPGGVVDAVHYETPEEGWPGADGRSLSLSPDAYDAQSNDDPSAWCDAPLLFNAVEPSSPGKLNPACDALPESNCDDGEDNDGDEKIDCDDPDCVSALVCSPIQPGDLVITEIMQNPGAIPDVDGEWFEILNSTDAPIDLVGLELTDGGDQNHMIMSPSAVLIEAGGYAVLSTSADAGVDAVYVWEGGYTLGNGEDAIILRLGELTIDEVVWDGGDTFPDPNGASMNLDPNALDALANDLGSNWCVSTEAYSTGDLGTPGALNTSCAEQNCGNGQPDPNEECDDGNAIAGDGCEPDCTVTPGFCGDGTVDEEEGCDDGNQNNGDGCSAGCVVEEPVPLGTIVITEVSYNPSAVSDDAGEWIEIHNPTEGVVVLNDWQISDDNNDHHVIGAEESVEIQPGAYMVFGRNGNMEENGGIAVDYVYGTDINLTNTGDVIVFSFAGEMVDRLDYLVPPFPEANGESMQLDVEAIDADANDDSANWCLSSFATETTGTPGAPNGSCAGPPPVCGDGDLEGDEECDDSNLDPLDGCEADCTLTPIECGNAFVQEGEECDDGNDVAGDGCESDCTETPPECGNGVVEEGEDCDDGGLIPDDGCELDCTLTPIEVGDVVVTEIMQNPGAVLDSLGEWFEITNISTAPIDMVGWSIGDFGSDTHVVNAEEPLILEPGAYMVFGKKSADENGGVAVDYVYGSAMSLSNGDDEVVLSSPEGLLIDSVNYDGGPLFPDPNGASMQLDVEKTNVVLNDDGDSWCASGTPMDNGDFGTPGAENTPCGVSLTCGDGECDSDSDEDCLSCPGDCGPCDPCLATDLPGCGGCACEACVCEIDSLCCDVAWDASCVQICVSQCEEAGCAQSGGCEVSPVAGCGSCECEACVCDAQPACCELAWDDVCTDLCAGCGQDCGTVDGCASSVWPGCDGCGCESCVCALKPECCEGPWTQECVAQCDACGGGCMSDGCTESELPTCNVCSCQSAVCLADSFCCDVEWDADCVAACGVGQDCGSDGCNVSGLPGCDGCACEACVCEGDPTCCDVAWDQSCVAACGTCGQSCVSDGCSAAENPGCAGCECEACVCTADPGCCDVAWDQSCALACVACGQTCSSDGCVPSDSPGCNGCACEACVCAQDTACCDVAWDEGCAQACDVCTGGCGFACGNGVVEPGEGCDDGVNNSDLVSDACRTDCTPAACGDQVVDTGEDCDDGNATEGDGCDLFCFFEGVSGPVAGSIVISEVMYNPQEVFDDQGEWFEVASLSNEILNLNGISIENGAGDSHVVDAGGPLYIQPGEYLVFGTNDDLSINGGVEVDYAYGSGLLLNNAGGDTLTLSLQGEELDVVVFDNGGAFPTALGVSLTLGTTAFDPALNDLGSNWCLAVSAYGTQSNLGTPGIANDPCPYCGDGLCNNGESCEDCANDCGGCGDGCTPTESPGCPGCACEDCVCTLDPGCCSFAWDAVCASICVSNCGQICE